MRAPARVDRRILLGFGWNVNCGGGFATLVVTPMRRFALTASLLLFVVASPLSCARNAPPATAPASTQPQPAAAAPAPAPQPPHLPDRLSDAEFWKLTQDLSEPGGTFRSDNLLSNEVWLQYVIPDLLTAVKPGGVYIGVGPEQNFTYISALKPPMAFIIDVRRGNLDLHLMYKALFEMSSDRAEFVGRLFSRRRPEGLSGASSVREIFDAYGKVPPDEGLYTETLQAIVDRLQQTHHFALEADDVPGIKFVFEYFSRYGPDLTYWMSGGFGGRGGFRNSPTYADLMMNTDASGAFRSYLASEENYNVIRDLEMKNLLVPVVGNFAGPKAIRAVGAWLKEHNGRVAAFYLSNVEQYLNMDSIWMDFCSNASTLPLDDSSQFIRSYRGPGFGGGSLSQGINPMVKDLSLCAR
jgi:hypothetical protein